VIKKVVPGVIVVIWLLTFAIGGTIMLFTAQTKEAKNTVKFGNLNGFLQEWGGLLNGDYEPADGWDGSIFIPEGESEEVVIKLPDGFDGIKFGNIVPNQQIAKFPSIARKDVGGSPAYVLVKAEICLIEDDGTKVEIDDDEIKAFISDILDSAGEGGNWSLSKIDELTGYYYYVNDDGELKELFAPINERDLEETPPIFANNMRIPNAEGKILEEFLKAGFSSYKINVDLTAYMVQSKNNGYEPGDDLFKAFAFFGESVLEKP